MLYLEFIIFILSAVLLIEFILRQKLRNARFYIFLRGRKELIKPLKAIHPTLEDQINFNINSTGERGDEYQPGSKRILFAGGSSVESFFVDQKSTWPEIIKKKLSGYHVGNVGKSGFDSKTLAFALDKIKPNYKKVDLIIIMVGASDVLRWLENDAPQNQRAEDLRTDEIFAESPIATFTFRRSAFLRIYNLFNWRRFKVREEAGKWYKKARQMRKEAEITIEELPTSALIEESFETNLQKCLEIAKSFSEHIFVIRQPWFTKASLTEEELNMFWNGGVGKAYKEDVKKYYSHTVIAGLMQKIDAATLKICEKNQIASLDLKPLVEPNLQNYTDQFHFTNVGSKIVGECVFEALKKNKLVY